MNFNDKLVIVLAEIKKIYNLSDGVILIMKNSIINRVKMYSNIEMNFHSDEPKAVINENNIGDILINRLINNIRDYEFSNTYNLRDTTKGSYESRLQKLYLANPKFLNYIHRDKLKNRIPNVSNDIVHDETMVVFHHEIGHALQASFNSNNGINNHKYQQLINTLALKYPNDFKAEIIKQEPMEKISRGMIPPIKNDSRQQMRSFYGKMSYSTHLDEIFNEEEALNVTGINKPQFIYNMGNGFSKPIYNYCSSYYRITSYATIMKTIMGKQMTFDSMYNDSILTYEFFDQFQQVSDHVFNGSKYCGKSAMLNILNSLDEIKKSKSIDESIKLDLFLAECYRIKISEELNSIDITNERLTEIKKEILLINNQMLHNPNQKLKGNTIMEELENKVLAKLKKSVSPIESEMVEDLNTPNLFRHPKAKELNELEKLKQLSKQNNDEIAYNYAKANIKRIIQENSIEKSQEELNSMSIAKKLDFIKLKIQESRTLDNRKAFDYWNSNLKLLQNETNKGKTR